MATLLDEKKAMEQKLTFIDNLLQQNQKLRPNGITRDKSDYIHDIN